MKHCVMNIIWRMCLIFSGVTINIYVDAQTDNAVIGKVDPFIGVHGGGNLHPCATLPYSVVSLGPDVEYVQSPSGYGYVADRKIIGFSHARTSGTGGGGRYGNFLVMPQAGSIHLTDKGQMLKNDFASPGYYSCDIEKENINVALTLASPHVGFHQYTFRNGDTATILLDVSSTRLTKDKSICTEAHVDIVSDRIVKGYAKYEGGWGGKNPYTAYFYAEFEQPSIQRGTWNTDVINPGKLSAESITKSNLFLGAFFKFLPVKNKNVVKFKLAMSYTSIEQAKFYFKQSAGWDFTAFKKAGENVWAKFLNRIKVQGGTADQQKLFYTSFYRQAMLPRDLTGDNPLWKSSEPHFWDFFTFWDTYRTANPLLTIIDTKKEVEIIRCLDVYRHKGWLPEAWTGGDYGQVQGGSNPDMVVGEAIVKGLKGFDYNLAYKAMINDAEKQAPDPGRAGRYVNVSEKYGYLPVESLTKRNDPPNGTSRTLEYSYNDYAIALAAKKLNKTADYEKYLKRSGSVYTAIFNDSLKLFWAKNAAGNWLPAPEDKGSTNGRSVNGIWGGWNGPYYEGSPLSYSCSAMQDIERLIKLHGGPNAFIAFLDDIFDGNHFESDNEPAMHLPYMYIYAGDNHKTFERLKQVFAKKYASTRSGWPGNDDAGTTSAWYMWGNMGMYPMAGQDIYLLTTPSFSLIDFNLESGRHFSIETKNLSASNSYILSATLNGKPWNQPWIRYRDIMAGGKLVYTMGVGPSVWGTKNLPPSFDKVLND